MRTRLPHALLCLLASLVLSLVAAPAVCAQETGVSSYPSAVPGSVQVEDGQPIDPYGSYGSESPPATTPYEADTYESATPEEAPDDATEEEDDEQAQGGDTEYEEQPYATGEVSIPAFQAALAPYGTWMDYGIYGQVWLPSQTAVGSDFTPYTCGHWVLTDYGWTWSSCYDWGWAPFHYGRWITVPAYGWAWVPGTEWAPAWVDWRVADGFIGWEPLGPDGWVCPMGRSFGWTFVDDDAFLSARPTYVPPSRVPGIWRGSMPCVHKAHFGAATYNPGPRASYVAYVTRQTIAHASISAVPHASPPADAVRRGAITPVPRPGWMRSPATPSGMPVWERPLHNGATEGGSPWRPSTARIPYRASDYTPPLRFAEPSAPVSFAGRSVWARPAPMSHGAAGWPAFERAPAFRAQARLSGGYSGRPTAFNGRPAPVFRPGPAFGGAPVFRPAPAFRPSTSFDSRSTFRASPVATMHGNGGYSSGRGSR